MTRLRQIKLNMIWIDQQLKSVLSSGELEKYKYLTGEDLGYKPRVVEQAKLNYSSLGEAFNKVLKEDDKKEGLLKRLKNIENKTEKTVKID